MRAIHFIVLPMLLTCSLDATAAPGKAKQDEPIADPPAGGCIAVGKGLKRCATKGGRGSFDIYTFPPASLYVDFEEPIVHFVPPDENSFQFAYGGNIATIAPKHRGIPERSTIIISTKNLTVTLNVLRGSPQKFDTQLKIIDPDRAGRETAVARALKEKLEPMASERAESLMLEDLAASGDDIQKVGGATTVRNAEGLVVLRAKHVLRVGSRRFLVFTVQNLSSETFDVKAVRLWLGPMEAGGAWKIGRTAIAPKDEPYGAIALPAASAHSGASKAKFVIEASDPRRNIELTGLEIP